MDSIKVSFGDTVYENGYIWVFDNFIQAICKINTVDLRMEVLSYYKSKKMFYARRIFLCQDKFYLVTPTTTEILIYDRKKQGEDSKFSLQKSFEYDSTTNYVAFFLYNRKIYFFPEHIDKEIICFEIDTGKYRTKTSLGLMLNIKGDNSDLLLRHRSFCEGSMWFTFGCKGVYGRYDFAEEKVNLFGEESAEVNFDEVAFDGEQVWTTVYDCSSLICGGKQIIKVPALREQFYLHPIEEGMLVSFDKSNMLIFVERETFKTSIIKLPLNAIEKQHVINYHYYNYNGFVYAFNVFSERVLVLDKRTWEIECVQLKCNNYIKDYFGDGNALLNESSQVTLKQLIQFCERDIDKLNAQGEMLVMGKSIWKALK